MQAGGPPGAAAASTASARSACADQPDGVRLLHDQPDGVRLEWR